MGHHDLAQRHYVQALRLARAAGDIPFGGYVLVTMAMQAALRGFHEDAIDMAQGAFERAKHVATPRTLAFFRLIEARAHAGDRRAAGHALAASERLLGLATPAHDDPSWIDFYRYSRLAADATEIHRDLNMPDHVLRWNAEATMSTSRFVRSYGMRLAIVGSGHLQAGQLDEGLVLGHQSIDVLNHVASRRSLDYLRDFTARLEPWNREPAVQEFQQRALWEARVRAQWLEKPGDEQLHQMGSRRLHERIGGTRMGVIPARVSQIECGDVATIEALTRFVEAPGGRLDLVAKL